MNTFIQKIGVLAVALSAFLSASAYDFEVDGIYYNITDPIFTTNPNAKEVEVTYKERNKPCYSGDMVIPSTVSYNGEQYSVRGIEYLAFKDCSGLTTITLPNSIYYIESEAFSGCSGLSSINLPDPLTYIGDHLFFGCSSLTSIIIPNSVTEIDKFAFDGCSGLTSITLSNSLTTIGYQAFCHCSGLTSITLPNSLTTIGNHAFSGCSSLTSIKLPNSLESIENNTFAFCTGMKNIEVDADNQTYSSYDGILYNKSQTTLECCPAGKAGDIVLPNSVTAIGGFAFQYCSGLTSIILPDCLTSIGEYAFSGCSELTSIALPNSITSLENEVFFECTGLRSITIPESVTSIGNGTFQSCYSLTSVTSLAVNPPKCGGERVFLGIDKQKCMLYVPAGSVEAYKQAPQWKDFESIEAVEADIDSVAAGSVNGATEVFNLTGAKVADSTEGLPAGIYLVREGSAVHKVAIK